MKKLSELWRSFMDWYGNYHVTNEEPFDFFGIFWERYPSKYKAYAFLPFVIVAFFIFFFTLFYFYG
jgi:hypothetical protein